MTDFSGSVFRIPAVYPQMRIGLMGGSFNPPHDGHKRIALEALKRLSLDQVWWMVSPGNPLKSNDDLAPLEDRITAASELASSRRIVVTAFEMRLATRYAVDTVAHLTRLAPRCQFVWVGGGDLLAEMHRWHDWKRLFRLVPVVLFDRPGYRYPALSSPAAITFANSRRRSGAECVGALLPAWAYETIPPSPQSSTAIRRTKRQSTTQQGF